jgi:hypothetical protein
MKVECFRSHRCRTTQYSAARPNIAKRSEANCRIQINTMDCDNYIPISHYCIHVCHSLYAPPNSRANHPFGFDAFSEFSSPAGWLTWLRTRV